MDQEIIEQKEKLLNSLIAKNEIDKAVSEIETINKDFDIKSITKDILNIKAKKNDLDLKIHDEVISTENIRLETSRLRNKVIDLKDKILYVMEHGEEEKVEVIPDPENVSIETKITIIDIAIVVLTSLVFIVLLVAFAIGLLKNPMNQGLIAFASAIMIVIILYLRKYKRDLGKGVYQMK